VLLAEKIELSEDEYYREMVGFDDRGAFRRIFESRRRALEPKTFLRVMTRKSEAMMGLIHRRQFRALPGVEAFVRGVWRSYPLAICSGALREEIEAMLEGVSLRDCFQTIVAAEDVTVGKPDPQGYLLAAELVSHRIKRPLRPADCLVIEDAPSVIGPVKTAGFRVLAVASTYSAERLSSADWVVKTLEPQQVVEAIPDLQLMES
jgi:beta-phosphoglucomutase